MSSLSYSLSFFLYFFLYIFFLLSRWIFSFFLLFLCIGSLSSHS
jgi:hypothetical protein